MMLAGETIQSFGHQILEAAALPYSRLNDGSLHTDGVVSRKKQLLPVVLGLLEG
ncbi:MAG: hypothetical protein NTZ24_06515 [Deltaproteobacteria bacterium]|nr:hypothetical protein [Deltaproteobacteria bacterium]